MSICRTVSEGCYGWVCVHCALTWVVTSGTRLSSDGHTCEDLDECKVNNGGCSHGCLSTLGYVFCTCPAGYLLDDDWKTCNGQSAILGNGTHGPGMPSLCNARLNESNQVPVINKQWCE